jgi:hypothetical protein
MTCGLSDPYAVFTDDFNCGILLQLVAGGSLRVTEINIHGGLK